jgi:hypothetical protein
MFLHQRSTILRHKSVFLESLAASSTRFVKTSTSGTLASWRTAFRLFTTYPSNWYSKAELDGSCWRRELDKSSSTLGLLVAMTNSPRKKPRSFANRDTFYIFRGRRRFLCQPVVDCNYRRAKVRHNEHTLIVVVMDKPRSIEVKGLRSEDPETSTPPSLFLLIS